MPRRLSSSDPGFAAAYAALIGERGGGTDVEGAVRPIIADVRARGIDAVIDATARFDGLVLSGDAIQVPEREIDAAIGRCPDDLIAALKLAAARIRDFHQRQKPEDLRFDDSEGLTLGWRWTPVDVAGLYAPGGLAAYPSAVLMNAIPAKIAGVGRVVMATPPGKLETTPAILAAARIAGVDAVYRVGGAQAIAALAYGAGPIPQCDVIAGPGNSYVATAKKLVFGDVGIDSIAGPSEVFILADGSAPPDWIAADLLAQAEHDPEAQSVLFLTDDSYGDSVVREVEAALANGQAGQSAAEAWERYGAIIHVPTLEEAIPLIDLAAAEHVQIATADPDRYAAKIRHAGAIFLGIHAPEALGDYIAGPNHVLPTGKRARFASGLSTLTFMKRTTLVGANSRGVAAVGPAAALIADSEGLPAHARSLRLRLGEGR